MSYTFTPQSEGKNGLGDEPRTAHSLVPAYRVPQYISVLPLTIIAVIAVFYVSTLREGHKWGDDFSMYLLHAKSIVEGKGYAETPYLYNSLYPEIGPKAYPPVTSIALAPVYRLFGLNVTLMKITICAFFFAALWVLFWTYRLRLPNAYVAGLILLLGFNPYFWDFKDEILSDFPFLFFVYATLYAVQRHYDDRVKVRFSGSILYAMLVGASMYLAYATRVVGVILPASVCLYELIRFKRLSRFAVVAILVTGTLIAGQTMLLPDVGSGYLNLFKSHTTGEVPKLLLENAMTYITNLSSFLDNGHNKSVKMALFLMMSLLAALGLRRVIKDGVTILEVFLFLYLAMLVITPFQAPRYLFPIIPVYFFYAGIGAMEMRSLAKGRSWQYGPIILAGAVVLSYASKYPTLDYGPIREGIAREESKELFQYIREHTEIDDVMIFRKPRVFALLTGRKTSIFPRPSQNPVLGDRTAWNYFQSIGARYLILTVPRQACCLGERQDIEWLQEFVERYKERCEEVFSNADFKVYELKDPSGRASTPRVIGYSVHSPANSLKYDYPKE